jgi:hypothetical protein
MPLCAFNCGDQLERIVVSLDRKCLGASPRSQTVLPPLLLRGIFDKETRRKSVAVAGAVMELGTRIGLHELGRALRSQYSLYGHWGRRYSQRHDSRRSTRPRWTRFGFRTTGQGLHQAAYAARRQSRGLDQSGRHEDSAGGERWRRYGIRRREDLERRSQPADSVRSWRFRHPGV